jgi:exopolysaccharide biosynthesis polyprenyl glycosylphosphotransferase
MSLDLHGNHIAPAREAPRRPWVGLAGWERRYGVALLVVDALAVGLAGAVAQAVRFGSPGSPVNLAATSVPYWLVAAVMVPVWLTVMAVGGGYEPRVLGVGSEEFRRVFNAAVRFLALVVIVFYALNVDLARGFVAVFIPLATVLTLLGRYAARRWLHARRARGRAMHRVLVVGTIEAATELTRHLQRVPYAGFRVVGGCVPGGLTGLQVGEAELPVYGAPDDAIDALATSEADVLAIAGDSALAPGKLRMLAWELEGTGVDLIVAPAVTDVAGPRISIRPVAGVPLLHVEEPQLSGGARLFKECFDRTAAALGLVVLSPLLLAIAVVVRRTSPGPALFCQERVGRDGRIFTIHKFRTMVDSAEAELDNLLHLNEHDGVLFKVRDDPRRTAVGRWLRRFSLDELPQLWHVVTGHMSLVGPRPPLPSEVERYGSDVRRRLLVKPGLTGLWQVSGRADLPWEETVRLDLYYVDNWSPALDFLILWKTVNAVLRGRGAY